MRPFIAALLRSSKPYGFVEYLRLYSAMLLLLPFASVGLFYLAGGLDLFKGHMELLLLVSVGLPAIISAPIGHRLARSLSLHLGTLVEATEHIRAGEYGHLIDEDQFVAAPTEMLQLAHAFNSMSRTVLHNVETIQHTSLTDQLTGLCNRRHLLTEGNRILGVAIRGCAPCCGLMVDIDHFKNVNDTFGHPVGDRVLIHVSGIIAASIRESDMLARFGGEEFVVLAPNAGLNEAIILAERIRTAIANSSIAVGQEHIIVTVSIGVAAYDMEPEYGSNVLEDMIEKADKALYRAKQNGRNRVETWPFPVEPEATP
jgi:diguanylate cyclase (GGDEF) domain